MENDDILNNIYPGTYTNDVPYIIDDETGETLYKCKKCACCYSVDGNFCGVKFLEDFY